MQNLRDNEVPAKHIVVNAIFERQRNAQRAHSTIESQNKVGILSDNEVLSKRALL